MSDAIGRYFLAACIVFVGMLIILTAVARCPSVFMMAGVGMAVTYAGFRVARPGRRP
jgi:hypothetical protein